MAKARQILVALLLAALVASLAAGGSPAAPRAKVAAAPRGDGMWIWYVKRSGRKASRIARRARRRGIETVFIKAGDGGNRWRQFKPRLVKRLHASGISVCAWQFVYGRSPVAEAKVGAAAVDRGADCLVIDAEGAYEGRYASADRYMDRLRALVGPSYPIALSSFPYVDFHPGFPYSVFMRPGGAQHNLPQVYWKTIGDTVSAAYSHTYRYNRVYERGIQPVGQTYLNPRRRKLKRFRRYALSYGARGVSWWSWQETSRREFRAISRRVSPMPFRPAPTFPLLRRGNRGDLVVWAQQHLIAAGYPLPVTGNFGDGTEYAVGEFQSDHGLERTEQIGPGTWRALLAFTPVVTNWSGGAAAARSSRGEGLAPGAAAPASASLPAVRYEIPPGPR